MRNQNYEKCIDLSFMSMNSNDITKDILTPMINNSYLSDYFDILFLDPIEKKMRKFNGYL